MADAFVDAGEALVGETGFDVGVDGAFEGAADEVGAADGDCGAVIFDQARDEDVRSSSEGLEDDGFCLEAVFFVPEQFHAG